MNSFEKIKELIAATEADAAAFYGKQNKAAGTRLRKAYLEIKTLASEGRNEVTELKNTASK
ncbi:histone H1 [Pedobacter faecalis]|uniref:histone H1 n=1 Tax=Pedobacter faecalis TaxID=3041495 RepID=UPI0025503618|nr:histone H1 [Pedobacter sp. ELA7]